MVATDTGIAHAQSTQNSSKTTQLPSESCVKKEVLKIAEMKVAGKNANVRKATVFIADPSDCAALLIFTET